MATPTNSQLNRTYSATGSIASNYRTPMGALGNIESLRVTNPDELNPRASMSQEDKEAAEREAIDFKKLQVALCNCNPALTKQIEMSPLINLSAVKYEISDDLKKKLQETLFDHEETLSGHNHQSWLTAMWLNIFASVESSSDFENLLKTHLESNTQTQQDLIQRICNLQQQFVSNNLTTINNAFHSHNQEYSFPSEISLKLKQATVNAFNSFEENLSDEDAEQFSVVLDETYQSLLRPAELPTESIQALMEILGFPTNIYHEDKMFFSDTQRGVLPQDISEKAFIKSVKDKPFLIQKSDNGNIKYSYVRPINAVNNIEGKQIDGVAPGKNTASKIIDQPQVESIANGFRTTTLKTNKNFLNADPAFNRQYTQVRLHDQSLGSLWTSLIASKYGSVDIIKSVLKEDKSTVTKNAINTLFDMSYNFYEKRQNINACLDSKGQLKNANALKTLTIKLFEIELNKSTHRDYRAKLNANLNHFLKTNELSTEALLMLHAICKTDCYIEENQHDKTSPQATLKLLTDGNTNNDLIKTYRKGEDLEESIYDTMYLKPVISIENGQHSLLINNSLMQNNSVDNTNYSIIKYRGQNPNELTTYQQNKQKRVEPLLLTDVERKYVLNGNRSLELKRPLDPLFCENDIYIDIEKIANAKNPKVFVSISRGAKLIDSKDNITELRPQAFLCVAYDGEIQHKIAFRPQDARNGLEEGLINIKNNSQRVLHFGRVFKDARIVNQGSADEKTKAQNKRAEYSAENRYFDIDVPLYTDNRDAPPGRAGEIGKNTHLISFEIPVDSSNTTNLINSINKEIKHIFEHEHSPITNFGRFGNDEVFGALATGLAENTLQYNKQYTDMDFIHTVLKMAGIQGVDTWIPNLQEKVENIIHKKNSFGLIPSEMKHVLFDEKGIRNYLKNKTFIFSITLELINKAPKLFDGARFHELDNNQILKLMNTHNEWRKIMSSSPLKEKFKKEEQLNLDINHFESMVKFFKHIQKETLDKYKTDPTISHNNVFKDLKTTISSLSKAISDNTVGLLSLEDLHNEININEEVLDDSVLGINGSNLFEDLLDVDPSGELLNNTKATIQDMAVLYTNTYTNGFIAGNRYALQTQSEILTKALERKVVEDNTPNLRDTSSQAKLLRNALKEEIQNQDTESEDPFKMQLIEHMTLTTGSASQLGLSGTSKEYSRNNQYAELIAQETLFNEENQMACPVFQGINEDILSRTSPSQLGIKDPAIIEAHKQLKTVTSLPPEHDMSMTPTLTMKSSEVSRRSSTFGRLMLNYQSKIRSHAYAEYQDKLNGAPKSDHLRIKKNYKAKVEMINDAFKVDDILTEAAISHITRGITMAQFGKNVGLDTVKNAGKISRFLQNISSYYPGPNVTNKITVALFDEFRKALAPVKTEHNSRLVSSGAFMNRLNQSAHLVIEQSKRPAANEVTLANAIHSLLKPLSTEELRNPEIYNNRVMFTSQQSITQ